MSVDPHPNRTVRIARLERMRQKGMTLAEIAEIEGVSRARIGELLTRPSAATPEAAAARQARAERDAQIVAAARSGRLSQREIADEHGLSPAQVSRILSAAQGRQ